MNRIPDRCTICGEPLLNPHEITGLCQEHKVLTRNRRAGYDDTGQVPYEEAIVNVTAILGARILNQPNHPIKS